MATLIERLERRHNIVPHEHLGDCWVWTGKKDMNGYGRINITVAPYTTKFHSVHRLAYKLMEGDIPEDLELDHLCRVRACFNPAHLEPVSHRVNMERSPFARKEECVHGHPMTPENTYVSPKGTWFCRTCGRLRSAKYLERKRQHP